MNEQVWSILWIAVIVLLPLIPSVLLFKILPSTGEVTGPFHGVTIKFGGAFAGYWMIFLALVYIRPDTNHYHTWTVMGSVEMKLAPGESEPNLNDVFVRFIPPRLGILNQGAFSWEIPVLEAPDGRLLFPDVQLDLRGYRGVTIPLRRDQLYGSLAAQATYDETQRLIHLAKPIVLESTALGPAYRATVQAVPLQ